MSVKAMYLCRKLRSAHVCMYVHTYVVCSVRQLGT